MSQAHRQAFWQVLTEELEDIRRRRQNPEGAVIANDAVLQGPMEEHGEEPLKERDIQRQALGMDLTALAISGGGIRSATFALGVLQGLASFGLLRRFDFLSTVSGGGYIGSWLASWIQREGDIRHVEQQLRPSRVQQAEGRVLHPGPPLDDEPEPIAHLRAYSSYLAPRRGMFSADSWVLVATYARNILLNQLVLLPLCAAAVLVPRLLESFYYWGGGPTWDRVFFWVMMGALGLALLFIAVRSVVAHTRLRDWAAKTFYIQRGVQLFQLTIVLPLFLFAVLVSWDLGWDISKTESYSAAAAAAAEDVPPPEDAAWWAAPMSWFPGLFEPLRAWEDQQSLSRPHFWSRGLSLGVFFAIPIAFVCLFIRLALFGVRRWGPGSRGRWPLWRLARELGIAALVVVSGLVAGFVQGALLYVAFGIAVAGIYDKPFDVAFVAALGPPLAVVVLTATITVAVGLLGTLIPEGEREWWASLSGWLMIAAVAWAGIMGMSLFGSWLFIAAGALGSWARPLLASGWVGTALAGVLAGRSPRTSIATGRGLLDWLALVAPPVFLIGLFAAIALLVDSVQGNLPDLAHHGAYFSGRLSMPVGRTLWTLVGLAVFAGLMALRVDVNVFSLHGLYGNRLVRCYLGATRSKQLRLSDRRQAAPSNSRPPQRQSDPVTGFDAADDLPLRQLRINADLEAPYRGPYVLLNTAMNLLQGDELAWQERKAESFVVSAGYCGSRSTGYRRLESGGRNPLRLGTAMTLSGAAVSPNMGYHSSPAVTALLTVFNVRLGGWLSNPRHATPDNAGPRAGLLYLIKELFGRTNDRARYVYLSDGGHFDNLGLYELVRRRCRFIVICDGEEDNRYTFDALGAVVRKCQSDFGVRIDMDLSPIRPSGAPARSRWHCAIGRIRYDDVEPEAARGVILYMKASLTGDEPADVSTYAQKHPTFPHQPTLNQFFAESQFESYRALGLHIACEVFRDAMRDLTNPHDRSDDAHRRVINKLFSNLVSRWFPPPPGFEEDFLEAVQGYLDVQEALRTDPNLRAFSHALYPEANMSLPSEDAVPAPEEHRRAELHIACQMIQVMENAWLGVHLEGYFAHPMNRGWLNTFRRWASSSKLRGYWPILRGEFSKDFVRFAEQELGLAPGATTVTPVAPGPGLLFDHAEKPDEDATTGLRQTLAAFCDEFRREWPREEPLEDLLRVAWADGQGGALWLVHSPPAPTLIGPEAPPPGPCGLVLLWQPQATQEELEVLVWMRGPYRDLGLGRAAIKQVFAEAGERLTQRTLRTRYPLGLASACDERLRGALWRSFFIFYGFRPVTPAAGEERYLVLKASPDRWNRLLADY